jgi:hypothetical protein
LWQTLLDFIAGQKLVPRERILNRFKNEDSGQLASVLHDLLQSGLVFTTGAGEQAVYRAATTDELGSLAHLETNHGLEEFICVLVYREGPLTEDELATKLSTTTDSVRASLEPLISQGRIQRGPDRSLSARHFLMPLGQTVGWEAAVFDHFQAVVQAISQRLQQLSASPDVTSTSYERGGSTYTFDLWPGHPMQGEVERQLGDLRNLLGALRERVHRYNDTAGEQASYQEVVLYVGQCVLEREQRHDQAASGEGHHETES